MPSSGRPSCIPAPALHSLGGAILAPSCTCSSGEDPGDRQRSGQVPARAGGGLSRPPPAGADRGVLYWQEPSAAQALLRIRVSRMRCLEE